MFEYQQAGSEFLASGGTLLADMPGLGKEHPVNCKIMTPHGWREIGELSIGDAVTGSNGMPTRVAGVYPQGVKSIYRVRFSDGSSVEAGAEHLWAVEHNAGTTTGGRSVYRIREVLTTAQIAAHPFVVGRRRGSQRLYLPMLSAPVEYTPKMLPLPAYLVGQLIANGGMTGGGCVLAINAEDEHAITTRLHLLAQEWRRSQYVETVVRLSFSGITPALRDLGMCVLSRVKSIPILYLRARPDDRIALLQGLMDGDGSISPGRNRVTYHTTSVDLASDVRELVEGLGGIASVRIYDRAGENKPTDYQVRIRLPEWVLPFSTPRKADRYAPGRAAKPVRTVVGVEFSREAESVCIAVDAPDALYATEHCILTHNTKQALDAAKTMGARTILVVCPAIAVGVWTSEAAKWRPDLTALTVREAIKAGRVPKTDRLLVVSYDHLVATQDVRERVGSIPHDLLILDEAHQLKTPTAKRTLLIYGAGCAGGPKSLVGRCGATRLLTGTPILNHAGEIFSHLRALAPDRIEQKSYAAFVDHYCLKGVRTVRSKSGRPVNIETIEGSNRARTSELARRMRGFWLKRKVEDVLRNLPPLRVEVRRIDPAMLDASVLAQVEDSDEAEQLRRALASGDPESLRNLEGHMARLRRLIALAKVDAAVAWAEGALDAGEPKVAIWGHHVEALQQVHARMPAGSVIITGATTKRDDLVDRFQNDPDCRAGVFQIQAAGTALTMTACRRAIFVEQAWTPALNHQATKRHHRIGSTNAVLVEVLAAPGLDEIVQAILSRKLGDIQAIEEES